MTDTRGQMTEYLCQKIDFQASNRLALCTMPSMLYQYPRDRHPDSFLFGLIDPKSAICNPQSNNPPFFLFIFSRT
ncbi:MAG: hypothetical protein KJP23_07450, partial [Deltaproteobacteria bacterium]|nr:hypothetical protein [Deltaproteobacteria bacterium]